MWVLPRRNLLTPTGLPFETEVPRGGRQVLEPRRCPLRAMSALDEHPRVMTRVLAGQNLLTPAGLPFETEVPRSGRQILGPPRRPEPQRRRERAQRSGS